MRAEPRPGVDWSSYASQYDLMAEVNPAYQEILSHCVESVSDWGLRAGDVLADFGAGTGNFSTALAHALPHVSVLHIDSDPVMLKTAQAKADAMALSNWRVEQMDLNAEALLLPELAGAVTIHALYTLAHPQRTIELICGALRHGGHLYACDLGRPLNIPSWTRYLVAESVKSRGLWRTLSLYARTGIVRRENRKIEAARREGKYWSHTLTEYQEAIEAQKMIIEFASNDFYRRCDDLVIARKQCVALD